MKVKIKKLHPDAVIPKYSTVGDAGLDLTAIRVECQEDGNLVYFTGLAVEIPEGHVGLLFSRSSISKTGLFLTNAVGVIDSGYRGEITMKFKSSVRSLSFMSTIKLKLSIKSPIAINNYYQGLYNVGDRIGQLIIIPYPHIEFEEVDNLSESERGSGGYGSTGK